MNDNNIIRIDRTDKLTNEITTLGYIETDYHINNVMNKELYNEKY